MTRRIGRWLLVGLILGLGLTPATSRADALVTLQLLARPDGTTAAFSSAITPTAVNEAYDYIVIATLAPAGTFNANLLANDPTSNGTIGSWDYPNPSSGINDGLGATVYSLYEGSTQTSQVSFQGAGFLGATTAGTHESIDSKISNGLTSALISGNVGNASYTGGVNAATYTYPSNTGTQTPTGITTPSSSGNALWQNSAQGTGYNGGTVNSRGSGGNDLLHVVALAGSDIYNGIDDGDVNTSGTDQSPITVILESGSTSSYQSNVPTPPATVNTKIDNSFHVTSIGTGNSTLNINAYNLITGTGALQPNDKYLNISYTDNNGNQVHPGVGGSFSYSNQTSADPIIDYVGLTINGSVASGNTSVLTMNPNAGGFGNVLRNGTVTTTANINNSPTNGTDVGTYSGVSSAGMSGPATGSARPGSNSINVTLLASGTAANGAFSGTYTITNTSPGSTDVGGNKTLTMSANVGNALADTNNNGNSNGPQMVSMQPAGSSFDGLASTVVGSSTGPIMGGPLEFTTATIVQGQNNSGAQDNVLMGWRARTLSETAVSQGGSPSNPPLQPDLNPLISDVVVLSLGETNPTSVFALQMTYNTSLAEATVLQSKGLIYLGWLNPNGGGNGVGEWVNSVAGNTGAGGTVDTNVDSSYAAWASANSVTDANVGNFLGSWGVDLADGEVWAVLNHNSQFAVVPEPAAIVLAAFGVLGLLGARRRKKS